MDFFNNISTVVIPFLTLVIGFATPHVLKFLEWRRERARRLFIGIVRCKTPECLTKYRDFTDYHKAVASGFKVVIVHCRTLSFALRKCDFVIANTGDDEKIISPNDEAAIDAILEKE